ncbi:bifunctional lytic transglycosylase/C40 family peptidase [Streptomyces anulatus]|uniref:C40 family peptidase n=1 Tax=Streptomyces anulatus TaxID=1892 RepID=UPI002E0F0440|nr:bifunctional lytic transglycosylase/C40 family peptidase [Streptomyces anulatus]
MKVVVGAVAGIAGLILLIVIGAAVLIVDEDSSAVDATNGGAGLQGVPADFRKWILKADADCKEPSMTPALLAAQLYQESKFKTTVAEATSAVGAQGPAQFMPGTWSTWGRDADGNGRNSPWDIGDAVIAQGRMMCSLLRQAAASGYPGGPRALALAGYNAGWGRVQQYRGVPPQSFANGETYNYVQLILSTMSRFQGPALVPVAFTGSGTGPDALRRASTELGVKYSYGGGTPSGPSTGFCDGVNGYLGGRCDASRTRGWDCSSLVQYAYWPSVQLPRTAAAQYGATSNRPVARGDLKPGDLLFWSNTSGFIYHVGMYAGDGNVLHAPRTGKSVELVPLASAMPERDYLGATRP